MINFNSIRLSIIITSQHRPVELQRFFRSLNAQSDIDFSVLQIIFVEQGDKKPYCDI